MYTKNHLDYTVQEVDLNNPSILRQAAALQTRVFNTPISEAHLFNNTFNKQASQPSVYLGALKGEELIGFNAFISHDLLLNGKSLNCFQSCWTATSPDHRKKGIFTNLIDAAKIILKEKGAGFIFGFPNHNSGPIFLSQLEFRNMGGYVKVNIPAFRFLTALYLAGPQQLSAENTFFQNDEQLIPFKAQMDRKYVVVKDDSGNIIWGKVKPRKIKSVPVNYLVVGGITVKDVSKFSALFSRFIQQTNSVFVQVVVHETSDLATLFKKVTPVPHAEPLIAFDLNFKVTEGNYRYNFFPGLKDVF
jgi:predicted N-acetyltransferase YhbS